MTFIEKINSLPFINKLLICYYLFQYVFNIMFGPESLTPYAVKISIFRKKQHFKRFLFISYLSFLLNIWFLIHPTKVNYINTIMLNITASVGLILFTNNNILLMAKIFHVLNLLIIGMVGFYTLKQKGSYVNIYTLILILYIVFVYIYRNSIYVLK